MSLNQIVPKNILDTSNTLTCIICMDDSKKTVGHNCTVCKKNSWKICLSCLSKLDTCPICRSSFNPINPNNITININITSSNDRSSCYTNAINSFKEYICCILYIIKYFSLPILFMYIGKCYIYIYCKGTCDKDKYPNGDGCTCYTFANRDIYWGDLAKFVIEFFIGLLGTMILAGCCIKHN